MIKIFVILLIILSFIGCATYDYRYASIMTTEERIQDVIILMGFGAGIGITIYEEVK